MEQYNGENIENESFQRENESEYLPINMNNNIGIYRLKNFNHNKNYNYFIYILISIIIISLLFVVIIFIINKGKKQNIELIKSYNNEIIKNNSNVFENKDFQISQDKKNEIRYKRNINEKIGIAFINKSIFANGFGRMLSLLLNELVKYEEKYKIFLITDKAYNQDFVIDEEINRLPIYENKTLIAQLDKDQNIQYYVLNNEISLEEINFYRSFNKKLININHRSYLPSIYANNSDVYKRWKNFLLYDAFISSVPDDYYIYKNLGMNNTFFIPNLYIFEPFKTPSSSLLYQNIIVMGIENGPVKGDIYVIKVMKIVVKYIPKAKLYFISSDDRREIIKDLIKENNMSNNIEVLPFTTNIEKYFLNSSVMLCPSLSESLSMVINEGKAYGLPIVAFNMPYSAPYQKGVILIEMFNVWKMAKETYRLLNDYFYRKDEGSKAKLSLNEYSNTETLNKWNKLFFILNKDDSIAYQKLQEYTYDKYYDEKMAEQRLEYNYNYGKKYNKAFQCHSFKNMTNLTYINQLKSCLE